MLAKFSIRTKITAVVLLLLLAMSAMGALSMRQLYVINDATTDIVSSWLPSVRVVGEVRAATITYRATVRAHLLAIDDAGKQAQEELLGKSLETVEKARKAYEPLISSPAERALYNAFNASWGDYLAGVKQVLVLSRHNQDHEARVLNAKVALAGAKAEEILQEDIALNNKGADAAGMKAAESF